jgi:nucleoside-diphosphate-sugar epimerase
MKVLVTGGSGYLGNHVRRYFDADDLSRRSGRDILELADVADVSEYDVVIHLAAFLDKSTEAAEAVFFTNVEGTVNVLRNVRRDSVFIFASTKDVYGRFADNFRTVPESCPTLYAGQTALEWSKLIAERYVEYHAHQYRFRACIMRLSTVYAPPSEGNEPSFAGHYAEAIDRGEPIVLPGEGKPVRDLLHVDDLSRACEAFINSPLRHGLYNVGGGPASAATLREIVAKMEEVSGSQAVIAAGNTERPVPFNYVSDISLIDTELGWRPTIGLDDGFATLFRRGI